MSETNTYTFGTLTLTFRGLGVPFLSDRAIGLLDAMSHDELKAANSAAWKQSRATAKLCNRHCNWSANGNIGIYERAGQHNMVAELVRKETYKRMVRA